MQDLKLLTDEQLVEQMRLSRKAAFEELFNRFWHPLYRNCYAATKSHEESEEIAQDLLVSFWNNRENVIIENVSAYLNTAVRRRIIDRVRSKLVQVKYWDYYRQFIPTTSASTDELFDYMELQSEIEQIINKLPEKSQQVFRLSRLEGHSVTEISESLSIPKRTIEYHLAKSIKILRTHLKDSLIALILLTSSL